MMFFPQKNLHVSGQMFVLVAKKQWCNTAHQIRTPSTCLILYFLQHRTPAFSVSENTTCTARIKWNEVLHAVYVKAAQGDM